jgi:RNA polymerase sigma factor (sigma-70 family)
MEIDWQHLLSEHGPVVWKTVRCLVGNEADARDVYQETFLQAFQFSEKSEVDDWIRLLRRIARMRAMDLLRKRYRTAAHSDLDAKSEDAKCPQPLPEEQLAAGELSDRLRRRSRKVDAPDRQAARATANRQRRAAPIAQGDRVTG